MTPLKTAPLPLALLVFLLSGCESTPRPVAPDPTPLEPRALAAFDGRTGVAMAWDDVINAAGSADVIFLGETHDDAAGHAVELAVVSDVLERWPDTAVSMEMLERDEQGLVDDYVDGIIDADQLARLSFSTNWGAAGMWDEWYQPMIDAARDAGAPVVAANAPRRYVRLARTDGYERLQSLPEPRSVLFDHPDELPEGPYRDRFFELMLDMRGHETADEEPEEDSEEAAEEHAAEEPTDEPDPIIEAMFRAQLVWDATMAASIADALERGSPRVIHVIGQFHCDFEGGTVQQLRERRPDAKVLVISLQPVASDELRPEDVGRAEIVIYTR